MRFFLAFIVTAFSALSGCAQQDTAPSSPVATAEATPQITPTLEPAPQPQQETWFAAPNFDIARKLPAPATPPALPAAARAEVAAIRAKMAKFPTFAAWQRITAIYKANAQYESAAAALRSEAAMYRAKKLFDAAQIREREAAEIATDVRLFRIRAATQSETKTLYSRAPLEPIIGAYRGAFIDRDDALKEKYFDENWQEHRSSDEFERLAGEHASYFMYVKYGQKFPRKWVEQLKAAGAIPHIAWEPKSLNDVRDDAYLKGWAQALRALDWPVFIRFAGEMNGDWTPYHGNPTLYKQKFRLVHNALHRAAPRVATIWCVNSVPLGNIDSYYPGDDGCDWVGINVYSVPFFDNNPKRPAFATSPLTLIDPIYQKYAARKPIAICEFAASFRAKADGKTRIELAQNKMAQLYSALPLLYPRIKMIDWFSMDTLRHAQPGRQLNNYRLTEHDAILNFYRALGAGNYFRKEPERLAQAQPELGRPLGANEKYNGTARLALWVQTYVPRPKVFAQLNGKIIYAQNRPGAHNINIDLKGLKGAQQLQIFVYDNKNQFITSRRATFTAQ
ncbi:MAG TPA: glycosyl hydrolase [Abditibacteriaceae bacterium]|jgi:hypothetical protein